MKGSDEIISQMESIVTNTCKALGAAGELITRNCHLPLLIAKTYQYAKALPKNSRDEG